MGPRYAADPRVVDDPHLHGVGGLSFPGEGWFWFLHAACKFRRFAAPLSPQTKAAGVETYLRDVTRIACKYFGRRVRPWHEGRGGGGVYDLAEVVAAVERSERSGPRRVGWRE